ncbi:hypothetical protein WOLCODRAFT_135421 [Wolfiporia cocos MD-104 SS10]|uniref:Pentacotripeptide-repeat region of PRORP domain-containing protein n=1 Tax=Wolfiporia cocos (strain MD-104) TaxID=742152 RepID=A0A2H3IVF4_WOLCO|nr:hypothetical protein WOLCODRAFT_135421 [Wolfiporia cocos MD-104 SS10]
MALKRSLGTSLSFDLGKDTYIAAFDVMALSSKEKDTKLMKVMFSDMLLRFKPSKDEILDLYQSIFAKLLRSGYRHAAYIWLTEEPVRVVPTREQWHAFIRECALKNSLLEVHNSLSKMTQSGCPPDVTTFEVLFTAFFSNERYDPQFSTLSGLLKAMRKLGMGHEPGILQIINDQLTKRGQWHLLGQVMREFPHVLGPTPSSAEGPETSDKAGGPESNEAKGSKSDEAGGVESDATLQKERDERLCAVASERGKWPAVHLFEQYKALGYQPTQSVLRTILGRTADLQVLEFWERTFGLSADATVWTRLISNATATNDSRHAVFLYEMAISRGVRPINAMLHSVLRALLSRNLRRPSEEAIDRALRLYAEFVRFDTGGDANASDMTKKDTTPDAPIYNTLLRALLSTKDADKYIPKAMSLVEEMKAFNVAMDSMTNTSLVVLLLRCSTDFNDALRIYKSIFQPKHGGQLILNEDGYAAVLNTLCNICAEQGSTPPSGIYFRVVKDMRAAGHNVSPKIYTIYLRRLADRATQLAPSNSEEAGRALLNVVKSIQQTHHHLSVDASITPDVALWNQLMDAYQRAQCFDEAFQVWQSLYRTGRHDNTSVSIILDACSYARAYGTAMKIWYNLTDDNFKLNRQNWNTWLECLCRLGRLDDALKSMCLEMGKADPSVQPDVTSAQTLISFASAASREDEVRSRIKVYLPNLWRKLPASLTSS